MMPLVLIMKIAFASIRQNRSVESQIYADDSSLNHDADNNGDHEYDHDDRGNYHRDHDH